MSIEAIKRNAELTADGLIRLAGILDKEPSLEPICGTLKDRAAKLRNARFTIVVVGEFKRGKSTVLNAVLGKRILPQKATSCTAVLTIIQYGEKVVRVVFEDGTVNTLTPEEFAKTYELKAEDAAYKAEREDDLEELEKNLRAEIEDRFGHINRAEVLYPLNLCRNGIELVDSPGLSEHPAREKRVLEYLRVADAVVMVLSAQQLLNEREIRFIQQTLTPLGLRKNVFLLINRWNQIIDGLVDPTDPNEVREAFAEQQKLIDARLKPMCRVDGIDLSTSRIFCVDALKALRQRISATPSQTELESSNIPAFESSLGRYLLEDRHRARQDKDRNLLDSSREAVQRFVANQIQNAEKPLAELKKKDQELQPKLDKLREVGRHIDHFLTSTASQISTELAGSFDVYMGEHIIAPLYDAVQKFDLGRAEGLFVSFDAAADLLRPEHKRFKTDVSENFRRQISNYLKPKVIAWSESLQADYLKRVTRQVQAELQREADNYLEIIDQIEGHVGGHAEGHSVQDQLKKWLSDFQGPEMLKGSLNNLSMDLAPLMGSLLIDIASHMMLNFLPGIGFLISGILILLRRNRMREKLRSQVYEGMTAKMPEFRLSRHEAIREALTKGFDKIRVAIDGKISEDIALIDASLKELMKKKSASFSAASRRRELHALTTALDSELKCVKALLQP